MKLQLEQKGARIELIPLIDIIFLLLVFLIYSMLSMVVYRGIPVNLPAAETAHTQKGDMVVITIEKDGRLFFNRESIRGESLLERLKEEFAFFPDKAIVISGHRDVPYSYFVKVLDQVRMAGFQQVSIEARPREQS
jgi:biopolymer transport protein ExbD